MSSKRIGKFLFKVQDTFQIKNVGLTVVADVSIKDSNITVGDKIEFQRKDGLRIVTKIESIPMIAPYDPERRVSFTLPQGIVKEDMPIGTEVYKCAEM